MPPASRLPLALGAVLLFALAAFSFVACSVRAASDDDDRAQLATGTPATTAAEAPPPTTTAGTPLARATSASEVATAATGTPTAGPSRRVTLAAVGDIMLARAVSESIGPGDDTGPFTGVAGQLAAADVTVGNLESALGDVGAPEPKAYTFQGPAEGAQALAAAGVDVVSQSNNHAMDYGPAGLLETQRLLDRAGIKSPGAGATSTRARQPQVIERNGLRIAFLAYADVPVEWTGYDVETWTATGDTAGIAWFDAADVRADVAAAKRTADVVVVMMHFGQEGWTQPTDVQRYEARTAIDAGASLVLGAHPHMVQPVERYGTGLIAYSLGNFVFDGFEGIANESVILDVTLTPDGVADYNETPVTIGWDGLPRLP